MDLQNTIKKLNQDQTKNNTDTNLEKIIDYQSNEKLLIEIKNLTMSYKKFRKQPNVIFHNVNFKIYENEVIALLGANGCGKTTLIDIISGVKEATDGQVIFHYKSNIESDPIGIQFQDINFPKSLTVKDLINFQLQMTNNQIDKKILAQTIQSFKLSSLLNASISKLSGGQQQRLNVLLAILSKPKVLFLDEFTTGLDIAIKNEITSYIVHFAKQNLITVVLISHDIDTITNLTTRFILIANKEIVIDTDKKTILEKFQTISNFLFKYIV